MTRSVYLCLCTAVLLLAPGCSDEQFETAAVSGTVISGADPVSSGTIIFNPIATGTNTMVGKSATGFIEDGKFTLSTYGNGDGAVVGEHSVIVTGKETPPADVDEVEWGSAPNWGSTTATFKVVAGVDNSFEIKLTPPAPKKRRKNADEDDDDD
ncbi:MAG: hypothetical protein ABJZ55_13005 [Fuerstiella sp.]